MQNVRLSTKASNTASLGKGYSFFFSSRRRHTRSVSAFLLNRSSDLRKPPLPALTVKLSKYNVDDVALGVCRSEERFSRNAETDLVCRLLLEKKKILKADAIATCDALRNSGAICTSMSHPKSNRLLLTGAG